MAWPQCPEGDRESGIRQSQVDLILLYAMGVMGLFMRLYGFPTAPAIIGMILGPLTEQEFRRAMQISQGDALIFLQKPLSQTLLVIALLAVVGRCCGGLRVQGRGAPMPRRRKATGSLGCNSGRMGGVKVVDGVVQYVSLRSEPAARSMPYGRLVPI